MLNYLINFFLVGVLLFMSSCATVFVRTDGDLSQDSVYPATTFDAQFFFDAGVKGEPLLAPANLDVKNGVVSRVLFMLGGLVDLPVSILTDTLFLPFDLYVLAKEGDKPFEE